ncbi:MAG: PAS domain S-box protein, partial [Chlorobiales bacterium]|nr:PAS domain S-box protein [Chlorobiales bacterium]
MDAEKIKILLVDDSPEDREVTKIQLCRRNKDLVCIEFESADAAIPSFSAESYDCILSDFQMPGKDGLDFLKFVRSEVGDIPFIFYTGQGNEEIAASAFRMGADDYFTKEIGFAHYQRLINSIIRLVKAHKTRINRSKAEVALKESEERFRILAESAFDGVIVHQNGKIVYSNQGSAETFGYEISDIVGSEFLGFVAEESKSLVNDKVRSASEEPYEAICIRKDGTRIPVEVCGREIVAGGSRGRVVALRDLSKREERKEALRRSEEKYRALFNNANDAIYLWELNDDGGPGKCLDVNDVACRRMGYSREEFLKMTPADIDDRESVNKIPEVMKRL